MYKGFGRKSNNLLGHKNLRLGKRVHISVVKRGRLATFHCENWKYFQDILRESLSVKKNGINAVIILSLSNLEHVMLIKSVLRSNTQIAL